jgi:hypothetical protein
MSKSADQNARDGSKSTTDNAEIRNTKSKRSPYVGRAWFVLIVPIFLLFQLHLLSV